MKKLHGTYSVFCIFFFVFLALTACKKNDEGSNHSPSDGKFSFTYNGSKYVLPYKEGTVEWSASPGIYIYRPDIFNGTIHFPSADCAYLEPNGSNVGLMGANCELDTNGFPIDSLAVYLYHSGSFHISYKNCHENKEVSWGSGNTIVYSVCDADGTFDLTLKNKENKTIVITEGTFEMYNFRR